MKTFYHGTRQSRLKNIKVRDLLSSNITKVFPGYPTNKNRVFVTTDLDEAKFYTKLYKKWVIFKISLTQKEFDNLKGTYYGDEQYSFPRIPKSKIKVFRKN